MSPDALAAAGTPQRAETFHRVDRIGQGSLFAVVEIERWRRPNGRIAREYRTVRDLAHSAPLARALRDRRDAAARLAALADDLAEEAAP